VSCLVTHFERPANPGAEIQKAMGYYHGGGGPGMGPGLQGAPQAGGIAAPGVGGDFKSTAVAYLLDNAQRQAAGEGPNMDALLGLAMMRQQSQAAPAAPAAGAPQGAPSGGLSGTAPAHGKLIGFPYQGTHTLGNWESDNAVDVAVPVGTPLRAESNGVIGPQFGSLGSSGRFEGKRLHLVTGNNEYYYAHLSRYAPGIRPGVRVRKGQIIGYSGSANGVAHLHFGAKHGNPVHIFR
jgi:murein DD-endopeptidase MepM/ murein hydrolase activator NlpD